MEWVSVEDRLPEPETRVLVCAESRCSGKVYKHITAAMYEDGNVWREDSSWNFDADCNDMKYDEEQDDWKIPEGWYEYAIYNPDSYNYAVDDFVTHWMPLPTLPEIGGESNG